jgi:hypothetical protein
MAEAGMAYHLKFTDVGTASSKGRHGGSFLTKVDGYYGAAITFQCILNQDVDGAPHCYARFNPANPDGMNGGLDFLRNGTSDENARFQAAGNGWAWHGVVSRAAAEAGFDIDDQPALRDVGGTFPVFQPGKRFYVSRTATAANNLPETDQGRYWDATAVSYGAITPPLKRLGVDLGDFGIAIRNDTGTSEAFFYGDAGGQEKVGEVSTHVFQRLFPHDDQEDHPVTFVVFPGSGSNPVERAQQDRAIRARLFGLSLADNTSEMIDVMALGSSFDVFRATGNFFVIGQTRQNILSALIKHGQWHFFHDQAYNIDQPERTPEYIRWIEWAKQRS